MRFGRLPPPMPALMTASPTGLSGMTMWLAMFGSHGWQAPGKFALNSLLADQSTDPIGTAHEHLAIPPQTNLSTSLAFDDWLMEERPLSDCDLSGSCAVTQKS